MLKATLNACNLNKIKPVILYIGAVMWRMSNNENDMQIQQDHINKTKVSKGQQHSLYCNKSEINTDLCSLADWGKRWYIEFEPSKSNALCVSLKHGVEEHPPLIMNGVLIKESKVLSILEFHFDSHLTWDYMIDSTVRRCRQRLGCLRRISKYLGTEGLYLAYWAFVRPVAEYGGILLLGASATQLSKRPYAAVC